MAFPTQAAASMTPAWVFDPMNEKEKRMARKSEELERFEHFTSTYGVRQLADLLIGAERRIEQLKKENAKLRKKIDYYLDQKIWRIRGDPDLKRNLGL